MSLSLIIVYFLQTAPTESPSLLRERKPIVIPPNTENFHRERGFESRRELGPLPLGSNPRDTTTGARFSYDFDSGKFESESYESKGAYQNQYKYKR